MSTTDTRLKARKLRLDAYCPDEPMNPAVNMDTYILMATRLSEQATACEAAGALARISPRTGAPVTTTADACTLSAVFVCSRAGDLDNAYVQLVRCSKLLMNTILEPRAGEYLQRERCRWRRAG